MLIFMDLSRINNVSPHFFEKYLHLPRSGQSTGAKRPLSYARNHWFSSTNSLREYHCSKTKAEPVRKKLCTGILAWREPYLKSFVFIRNATVYLMSRRHYRERRGTLHYCKGVRDFCLTNSVYMWALLDYPNRTMIEIRYTYVIHCGTITDK